MTSTDRSDFDRNIAVLMERVTQLTDRLREANERQSGTDRTVQDLRLMPGKIDEIRRNLVALEYKVDELRKEADERQKFSQTVQLAIDNMNQQRSIGLRTNLIAVTALALAFIGMIVSTITIVVIKAVG